jgi:hypothetical protein
MHEQWSKQQPHRTHRMTMWQAELGSALSMVAWGRQGGMGLVGGP